MRTILLTLLVSLSSCARDKERPAPARPAAPVEPSPPAGPPGGIVEELRREAEQRPRGTPSVEQVLAALEQQAMPILRRQQVLATPLQAHYCAVASTKSGLGLSICEFDDEPSAKRGLERSRKAMGQGPTRQLFLVGHTLVTLISPQPGPDGDRARAAIGALSAR